MFSLAGLGMASNTQQTQVKLEWVLTLGICPNKFDTTCLILRHSPVRVKAVTPLNIPLHQQNLLRNQLLVVSAQGTARV